jgi:hypothetical protein
MTTCRTPRSTALDRASSADAAACRGEQASDAGQGVLVRKLQQVPFVFTQNLQVKWVVENCAMIEQLMSRSLAGDHQAMRLGSSDFMSGFCIR